MATEFIVECRRFIYLFGTCLNWDGIRWEWGIKLNERIETNRWVPLTHLTILVHFVVGELHLLEGHDLFPQRLAADWTVRMRVETGGRWRIRFACDQPR